MRIPVPTPFLFAAATIELPVGTVFDSLLEARSRCVAFARCPLAQKSTVSFKNSCMRTVMCSCRKQAWHGNICRHLLCVFQHLSHRSCPIGLIHSFWRIDTVQGGVSSAQVMAAFRSVQLGSEARSHSSETEESRFSDLTSLCKAIIMRSVANRSFFDMVRSTLSALFGTINKSFEIIQNDDDDALIIRNPIKVKTKGKPKIGCRRNKSQAEKQRNHFKKRMVKN